MTVQAESELLAQAPGISIDALAALARAVTDAAARPSLALALQDIADAARVAAGCRRRPRARRLRRPARDGRGGRLGCARRRARGRSHPAAELPDLRVDLLAEAGPSVRRVAARSGAGSILVLPVRVDGTAAVLELYRAGPFSPSEQLAAALAAGQTALVLRAFAPGPSTDAGIARHALDLAGDALAAALHETAPAGEVVRLAAGVVGAPVALLWQRAEGDALELVGSHGLGAAVDLGDAAEAAGAALENGGAVRALTSDRLPGGCGVSTTLALGEPPVGFLQLLFAPGAEPSADQLGRLTTFGVRAAHVLRSGARIRELEQSSSSRALLEVVGQATAELSLTHTLETAVARIAELLDVERVAVYLRVAEDRLVAAAEVPASAGRTRPSPSGCSGSRIGPARRRSARSSRCRTPAPILGSWTCATPRARPASMRRSQSRCSCATT